MKSLGFFLLLLFISCPTFAQKTTTLRNLWARPQVHVLFRGYTISFSLRDINRALELLTETGDYTYGTKCILDTGGNYAIELFEGTKTEYKNPLQPLIQNGVGAFLLTGGHAQIENTKHKQLTMVEVEIEGADNGENFAFIHVYDPKTKTLIFSGKMAVNMYNKDMGIDYY